MSFSPTDEESLEHALEQALEPTMIDEIKRVLHWSYARTAQTMMRLQMKGKVRNVNARGRGSRTHFGIYELTS